MMQETYARFEDFPSRDDEDSSFLRC